MAVDNIITERLLLIPFTLELASSLLRGDFSILKSLGIAITEDWPDAEAIETLPKIILNLETAGKPTGFESWMIVNHANMEVIGDAGFKGKPVTNNTVDIGYAIIEQEQGKGYGFEAAKALLNWALNQENIDSVTAKCLINNIASAKILRKLGLSETSRDEKMIHWEITKLV